METAGVLMISGSATFLAGAAIAVPRVFTEPDPQERRLLLERQPVRWRLGQPGYALGAVLAAIGVGWLAADATGPAGTLLAASCSLLVLGTLAWSWSVYLRALRPLTSHWVTCRFGLSLPTFPSRSLGWYCSEWAS